MSPATRRHELTVLATVLLLSAAAIVSSLALRDRLMAAYAGKPAVLHGVIAPSFVTDGDRYVLYAGADTESPETAIHVRICNDETGRCAIDRRTDASGADEFWGFIGAVEAVEAGTYSASVMVATPNRLGILRTVDSTDWTMLAADEQ